MVLPKKEESKCTSHEQLLKPNLHLQSVEFFVVRIRKNSSEKEALQWHRIVRNKSSIGKDSELMNMSI